VRVLDEELKNQQEQLSAGIVGKLNVQRAEVALANERPELFNAQTELKNSYLRLAELFGNDLRPGAPAAPFEISGQLQYRPNHPDLNNCLARADASRPVIKARQKDIEIEDRQYVLDRSASRPHVRAFSGYEARGARQQWKPWQQRGGASHQKCAVHFLILNKPSAYSKARQKTCRLRTRR